MKYARFALFSKLLRPFSGKARQRRMASLAALFDLTPGMRVLDLGGQPHIWDFVEVPLDITILNLPGIAFSPPEGTIHNFTFVEGDACDVTQYDDNSFEFVFSNSVIEHVGDTEKQAAFAKEVRRLGEHYWVQTPSIWFPVEAHTGVPFWFWLPQGMRQRIIQSWEKKLPDWTEMVKGTTVLSRKSVQSFFSDAKLMTERKYFFPKSYIAYR